jgi:phosphate uptake regulator
MEYGVKGMRNREVRKVQLTGKSTYTVSLPKSWVVEMGLKAGDGVILKKQEDSSLLIIPGGVEESKEGKEVRVKFSTKENPQSLARKIVSLYLFGYNLIHLESEERITIEQRELIRQFVRKKLMGTEITSDSPNELTIQVLLGYPELSVKGALRRMSAIAISMWEDTIDALKEMDQELAEDVIEMDDEVDRFSMYIIRELKSAVGNPRLVKEVGLNTPRDCLGYRLIAKSVERIADHAVLAAEKILQLKRSVKKDLLEKITEMSVFTSSIFEDSVRALLELDYEMADKIIDKEMTTKSLENEIIQLIKRESRRDATNLRLITESLRRVAEYSADIAEVVLNLTVPNIVKTG